MQQFRDRTVDNIKLSVIQYANLYKWKSENKQRDINIEPTYYY